MCVCVDVRYVCVPAAEQAAPSLALVISLCLINSLTPMPLNPGAHFLAKKSQSARPPRGLDYSALGFVRGMNSSLITPLLIHDLALFCSVAVNQLFFSCPLAVSRFLSLHRMSTHKQRWRPTEDKYRELRPPHLGLPLCPRSTSPSIMSQHPLCQGKSKDFSHIHGRFVS